jgi:hypothetical protein
MILTQSLNCSGDAFGVRIEPIQCGDDILVRIDRAACLDP